MNNQKGLFLKTTQEKAKKFHKTLQNNSQNDKYNPKLYKCNHELIEQMK